MARLQCRLTDDEMRTVDFYCDLFGLTRSEYLRRVATGGPLRPAALEAAVRVVDAPTRPRRAPVPGERRRHHVMLTLGRMGRESLLSCAASEGVSASEYVARHATRLETHFGADADASATAEGLVRAADGLGALGLVLNDLARAANTMAMIARRQAAGDKADMERCALAAWRDLEDASLLAGRIGEAVTLLDGHWGLDGTGEGDTLGHGGGAGRGGGGGAEAGSGGGAIPRGVAEAGAAGPGGEGGEGRTVTVRLSSTEVRLLDAAALYACLARSQWVLVSCTPLYPGWVPIDPYETARVGAELGREAANMAQAVKALDSLGEGYADLAHEARGRTDALRAAAWRGRDVARALVVRARGVLPVD